MYVEIITSVKSHGMGSTFYFWDGTGWDFFLNNFLGWDLNNSHGMGWDFWDFQN